MEKTTAIVEGGIERTNAEIKGFKNLGIPRLSAGSTLRFEKKVEGIGEGTPPMTGFPLSLKRIFFLISDFSPVSALALDYFAF